MAIARYNVGENIKASWDMKKFPDQWDALLDIIKSRNPSRLLSTPLIILDMQMD